MKYSDQNPPIECIMRQSSCYKGTTKGKPVGILWHDTAASNPNLWRYVQPDDNAPNKASLLAKIGKNNYRTDWNHKSVSAGVNAFIGKLADGSIATVQALPWNYRPWGCGSGPKGSCNGSASVTDSPFWIQFEIQDDGIDSRGNYTGSKAYFDKVYKEACEFTAYLCKKFNIDPNGTVNYRGVKVPTILCHWDSYKLGLGSGHYDIYGWFGKYSKDMTDVRKDVTALLKDKTDTPAPPVSQPVTSTTPKVGDLVAIDKDAEYYSGKAVPAWVKKKNWYVKSINKDRVVLGKAQDGSTELNSAFRVDDVRKIVDSTPETQPFSAYKVYITANVLNVRSGPSTAYPVKTTVHKGDVYTIVEEKNNWGKLKSGAGWISLKYTKKR